MTSSGTTAASSDTAPSDTAPSDTATSETAPTGAAPRDAAATDATPADPADTAAAAAAEAAEEEPIVLDPEERQLVLDTRSQERAADRARAKVLFLELAACEPGSARHAEIRDELVRMHRPLVEYLARRFRNRGEPYDDLVQVASIGLIKSVDRFESDRGVEFSTYATPTIVGEIKRHFRDKGWTIRVPRRLQELKLALTRATSELSQTNGRSPTVAELAAHLELSEEEILEGMESAHAYSAVSLDAPGGDDADSPTVADTLGVHDAALEGVEYRESLKPLLEKLPAREKRILMLRFFGNQTQSQIAAELGISQMHVSRLLARTLSQLRTGLLVEE